MPPQDIAPIAINTRTSWPLARPHATILNMADSKDKISAAAEADQPNPGPEKIVDASDADIALAAMGYKPVSDTRPTARHARA